MSAVQLRQGWVFTLVPLEGQRRKWPKTTYKSGWDNFGAFWAPKGNAVALLKEFKLTSADVLTLEEEGVIEPEEEEEEEHSDDSECTDDWCGCDGAGCDDCA
jgi:hypothetical protein